MTAGHSSYTASAASEVDSDDDSTIYELSSDDNDDVTDLGTYNCAVVDTNATLYLF